MFDDDKPTRKIRKVPAPARRTPRAPLRPDGGFDLHAWLAANPEPDPLSPCCQAATTYHDQTLCCKACWRPVPALRAPFKVDLR